MVQEDATERFAKSVESVNDSLGTIRTGRANPKMLDRVMVDYYGAQTPLKQLGNVSAPDASTLLVQVFDQGALGDIEKGIVKADLGLNPSNDGKVIRLVVPQLTQD